MTLPHVLVTVQGKQLDVAAMTIDEGINRILDVEATVAIDATPPVPDFVGHQATVTIDHPAYGKTTRAGLVVGQHVTVSHTSQHRAYRTLVTLTIRSNLFLLDHTVACSFLAVANDMPVDQLVREILDRRNVGSAVVGGPLPSFPDGIEMALTNAHPPVRNIVQVNESSFRVLTRTLSQMGIFFFYKPGAGGTETIVFADSNDAFLANDEPLRFLTGTDDPGDGAWILELGTHEHQSFDSVEVFSRNLDTSVNKTFRVAGDHLHNVLPCQIYHHEITETGASYLVDLYRRYHHHTTHGGHLRCDRPDIRAGQIVSAETRPDGETARYVVSRLSLRFSDTETEQTLDCRLELKDTTVAYADQAPLPAPTGTPHEIPAVVDGVDDRGYLDDKGRYFVKFAADKETRAVGAGSAPAVSRLRMSNTDSFAHSPLPPGTEVMVRAPETIHARPCITSSFDSWGKGGQQVDSGNSFEHVWQTVGGVRTKIVDGPQLSGDENETMLSFEARMTADTKNEPVYMRLGTPRFESECAESALEDTDAGRALKWVMDAEQIAPADLRGLMTYSAAAQYVMVDKDYIAAVCGNLVERILGHRVTYVEGEDIVIRGSSS